MRYWASHHTGGHWTLGTRQLVYRARRVQTLPHGPDTTQHCAPCSGSAPAADIMSPSCSPVFRDRRLGHLLLSLSHGPRSGSMFVTVCRPAVTSGIIVVVLPNLALEAGNQPGNSGAARGLAPGPVSAGCRGLALRMSPDRPGAVPMWQLWAGKVCQDTATITFIDHSRSNKFASVITG